MSAIELMPESPISLMKYGDEEFLAKAANTNHDLHQRVFDGFYCREKVGQPCTSHSSPLIHMIKFAIWVRGLGSNGKVVGPHLQCHAQSISASLRCEMFSVSFG